MHLYQKGFVPYYWFWTSHGEEEPPSHEQVTNSTWVNQSSPVHNDHEHRSGGYDQHQMESMVNDAFRSDDINVDAGMNANAEAFFNMLHSAQ